MLQAVFRPRQHDTMNHCKAICLLVGLLAWPGAAASESAADAAPLPDPYQLIAAAIDLNRGVTSWVQATLLVHRPDWQRRSSLVAWSRGRTDALVRFTEPGPDAGNATLRVGDKMWTYSPKLNRVLSLPFSLMSQSWAGSDFSYNDMARTDDVLNYYDLDLVAAWAEDNGHRFFRIEATPLENAPVVWGMEEWVIRDDHILVSQTFYDQEGQALKRLVSEEIGAMGGRVLPIRMRMSKLDEPGHYTEMTYLAAEFDLTLEDRVFTQFNLRDGGG